MKTVDEIHNKLYPQSSNEVETLCSHTSDNELRRGGVAGEGGIVEFIILGSFASIWLCGRCWRRKNKEPKNFIQEV